MKNNNFIKTLPRCPVEITLSLIDDKWKILILRELIYGTKRFSQLKKSLGSISSKVLTSNLRSMESSSLLIRQIYPEVPPRVEYTLTELGYSLKPVLLSMVKWGAEYKRLIEGKLPVRISSGNIILIEKATINDISKIFQLQQQLFSSKIIYLQELYKSEEELYNNFGKGIYFKAVNENEEVIGSLCASFYPKNRLEIFQLFVGSNFRNEGIAFNLLSELEKFCLCSSYEICINLDNTVAISFFENRGFIQLNSTKNYIYLKKEGKLSNDIFDS